MPKKLFSNSTEKLMNKSFNYFNKKTNGQKIRYLNVIGNDMHFKKENNE